MDFNQKILWEMLEIGSPPVPDKVSLPLGEFKNPPILTVQAFTGEEEITQEWGTPEPVAVKLPDVQKMNPEMLPECIRPWLIDISERMRCPLDFCAVTAIISSGSIIGTKCGIHPKQLDNWLVVANLWGVIIGDPSQLKTPATAEVLKLFSALEKNAKEEYFKATTLYKIEEEIRKADSDEIKRKIKNLNSDRENLKKKLLENENLSKEVNPKLRRYKIGDTTPEKVADLSADNPRGLFLFRDELMGLLKTLDKPGNEHHRAFYLESWTGTSSYTVDRVVKGSYFIERLCISIFGGTQPDKIKSYLYEMQFGANDGLLQRFQLMVYPDPVKMEYIDRLPDIKSRDVAFSVFHKLAEIENFESLGAMCDSADGIPSLRFSTEGQEIFIQWWNQLHKLLEEDELSPYLKEHFSKYRSMMPSLALIFHLMDCVQGNLSYFGTVSKSATQMAVSWCNYLMSHAKRVYNGLGHIKRQAAVELSKKLSSGNVPDGFSVRDIQQKCWHLLDSKESIKSAITELTEAGWVREVHNNSETVTGRPPAPRYRVNPLTRNFYSSSHNNSYI